MILKISNGTVIDLPKELNEEERLELVNKIIKEYPQEFGYSTDMFRNQYGTRQDNNKLVKIKLDILATYLIRADKDYTENVMSRYKEDRRPLQEMAFSQFPDDMQEINGWY